MDPNLKLYLCGLGGSAVVEVVKAWRFYERNHRLPAAYQKVSYWAVRVSLALFAGWLPLLYEIKYELLAFHLGASALPIFESMTRPPSSVTS